MANTNDIIALFHTFPMKDGDSSAQRLVLRILSLPDGSWSHSQVIRDLADVLIEDPCDLQLISHFSCGE